jgi:hypothetical protein
VNKAQMAALGLVALLTLLLVGVAWAGSSAVDWQVMSGGGAPSESGSGNVTLNGSLGQTAIGPSAAGGYDLSAGFWYGAARGGGQSVYLPVILKGF